MFVVIVAMLHFVLIILIFWKSMLLSRLGLLGKFARILESILVTLKMAAALPPPPPPPKKKTLESTKNL
jgi:hypothetical protein